MRVLAIVHQADAGPGVFADAIRGRGATIEEWRPPAESPPEVDHDAVIVCGGAANAHQTEAHPWLGAEHELLEDVLDRRVPVLGVCLGAQLLARAAGGSVRRAVEPEIGWCDVTLSPQAAGDPLLGALPERFRSLQWHSYEAVPPPGATPLARSAVCLQAYRLDGPAWGIQFHAEVAPADLRRWVDDYRSDPDAVAKGIDPELMWEQAAPALPAWNDLGRGICARFLDEAATRA